MGKSAQSAARRRGGLLVRRWVSFGLVVLLLGGVFGVLFFGAPSHELGRMLLQYIGAPLLSVLLGAAGLHVIGPPPSPPPPVPVLVPPRRREAPGKLRKR